MEKILILSISSKLKIRFFYKNIYVWYSIYGRYEKIPILSTSSKLKTDFFIKISMYKWSSWKKFPILST